MYVFYIKRDADGPHHVSVYENFEEAEAVAAKIGNGFIIGPLEEVMEILVELKMRVFDRHRAVDGR
jgi:hypothetical protein